MDTTIHWAYCVILIGKYSASELRVAVPSVGNPFEGINISFQEYLNNRRDDGRKT